MREFHKCGAYRQMLITCIAAVLFCFLTTDVFAIVTNDIGESVTQSLCFVTNELNGDVGKTIAILIVMTVAISLFLGKISWGVAMTIAVGMGLLFGSSGIVILMAGGSGGPC